MTKRAKISVSAKRETEISKTKIKATNRGGVFIFFYVFPLSLAFILVPYVQICSASSLDIGKIYEEQTSYTDTVKTETETSNYNLATGGEIDEELRCANDGNPSGLWLKGQRIPSFIPNIESVSVRSKAVSNGIAYALRAVVSTSAIATSTDASVVCLSEKSSSYSGSSYTSLSMEFSPACELDTNTNYFLYIQTEDCATFGAGYNEPYIARKYDAWGGRRYYDFFRTTSIINDYDLHAIISFASTTEISVVESEYSIPFFLYLFIFGLIVMILVIIKSIDSKKNGN
jgi:hypothetical protein